MAESLSTKPPDMRDNKSRSDLVAGPYNIHLSAVKTPGHTHVLGLTQESADKVSELLMVNHARYHTLFLEVGLHNHIVHHLLSIYALGASIQEVEAAYNLNKKYQLPQLHQGTSISQKLKDPSFFKEYVGKGEFYHDFLLFFQDEIAQKGVEEVLNEYAFKGDERAVDILGRMYAGFEHPIIHLGYGLEFAQPCLIAESLASASIHDTEPLSLLLPVESYLKENPDTPSTSLISVITALASDPVVKNATKPSDPPNRIRDALLVRAPHALTPHLAKWRVEPTEEDLKYKMAEMTHVCTYMSGAAQNPRKEPSIEFFMMHSTNLSVFFPTFLGQEWISIEAKARLLTWKGWMDAVMYAANACPTLYLSRVRNYARKIPGSWDSIAARATRYNDDGHTSKFIRAVLNAEKVSEPYLGRPEFPLEKNDFLQIAHMCMDSVERMNEPGYKLPEQIKKLYVERLGVDEEVARIVCRFVRWCGHEEAWQYFPDLHGGKARL